MNTDIIAKRSVTIRCSPNQVWDALTNPEKIKKFLFGTETVSDWKVGSPISWHGEWKGKKYEDKGKILAAEKNKLLRMTYWSSSTGKPDLPENYKVVTYELLPVNENTRVTITQDGNESEKEKEHAEKNWAMVLDGLKALLEHGDQD